MEVDNQTIYDSMWSSWLDMKMHGPASRLLRSLIHDQIRALERAEEITSVLDVGCGEGTITWQLAEWLPRAQIVGIDFSAAGIDCGRARYSLPNLTYEHDVESRRMSERFDMVTAFEVLEHIDDWQSFLARMAAAANKYVLLSFPTGRMRAFEVHVGHFRNYKKGEVEEFLQSQGFVPERIFYAGFPFYSPLYRELCNLTDSGSNRFTMGRYGASQKIVARILYGLFRHASTRRRLGDQFCGLFRRATKR
jgi:ubiquinone/menaquinone biosynthesis C-methylase UbiE